MTVQRESQVTGGGRGQSLLSIPSASDLTGIDLALDAMRVGIFEYDPVAGVHRFSARCKAIWGFAVDDELSPETILGRVHPDDRRLAADVWQPLAPNRSGRYSIEHRIMLPDGSIRWVLVSGHHAFSESGGLRRAVRGYGAMRDITESKIAEQQLYERTSQLQAFIDGAPVPIAIFDRAMRYVAFSQRYAEQRQIAGADLIGRSVYEVFPNMPEHLRAAHVHALNGATERREQDLSMRADGGREWVRWEVRPWYRADNEVGGIILFSELITQRIQEQQELRESRARLELAIRAGALGVFDHDMVKGTIVWDARIRELWGVGPDEEITAETFIGGLHPDDRERIVGMMQEIIHAGNNAFIAHEYRVVNRADGSVRWIAATGRAYFEARRIVQMVGVVQEITDRKRTELALAQSAEELRRADERKDVFLATLSHELRNPLAPIRTAAQILASPKLTPEQLTWVSQVIRRQTGHMASLLEDLLNVARISRGKLVLKKERVRLSSIAQSAIESVQPLIDEKHHRLLVTLPAESLTLHADPLRLSQVLSNLLSNAAKYTDSGGEIKLAATVEEGILVLRVKDNGIGIPREHMGKIFTMFWQAERAAGEFQGGLGIGLPFVEGIVQLHGGTIEARSEGPGRGSEFIVRLPVFKSLAPLSDIRQAATGADALRRHRILIVDDDKDTADTLEVMLTLSNYEVRVTYSGQEALSVARDFKPDMALLDLGMPGLDGCGVARALRQEPWASDLRLIALTGWGQPDDQRRATDAGFDEQLLKPIDPDKLQQLLGEPRDRG
jgi:PAS domain S-box-containing protein